MSRYDRRTPKASIIMAAFNHAEHIGKAISSALAQTWQDFELIVVDDGSTDATSQVVAQFEDRVRYIYQENRGQGAARNRGISSARGEFICFLDDDDLWKPGYLNKVMSVFHHHPEIDALYAGFQMIDSEGRLLPQVGSRVVPPHKMYEALIDGGWFPPLVVTVRKTCLDRVGPLDEDLRGHDDWDLWVRIARNHTFQGIADVLAFYRIHAGGLSSDAEHMLEDRRQAVAKHFGPEEGPPTSWPTDRRRAFGALYRLAGLDLMQSGNVDRGLQLLDRAFEIWPRLLERVDTFYELALGDQPRGYRGQMELIDIDGNGAEMLKRLDGLFAEAGPALERLRPAAYGNAYLALGMLSDQAGDWDAARRYLTKAIRANPRFLASYSVVRRLLKLYAGKRVIEQLRNLRIHRCCRILTQTE